jgi:hypothetical protein
VIYNAGKAEERRNVLLLPWWQNESIRNNSDSSRPAEIFQCLVGIRSDDPWSVPSVEELANKVYEVKFELKI